MSRAYACFLCMLPLLDSLCDGLLCSWGMRQTQKGIITSLPKHSKSMNYLRYARQAPRELHDWITQVSVREPWGQGPNWGIVGNHWRSRGNEQREIKWQKSKKGVQEQVEMAHAFMHRFIECMCVCVCMHLPKTNLNKNTDLRPLLTDSHMFPMTHSRDSRKYIISCRMYFSHILSRTHTPNYHQSQASEPSPLESVALFLALSLRR